MFGFALTVSDILKKKKKKVKYPGLYRLPLFPILSYPANSLHSVPGPKEIWILISAHVYPASSLG